MSEWEKLPEELISKILLKLPVITLVQCAHVCKQFSSIIKSPHFISAHLHHHSNHIAHPNPNPKRPNHPLLVGYRAHDISSRSFFSLHTNPKNLRDYRKISCPLPVSSIVGSVNGVICLRRSHRVYLWNPAVSRCLELPPPPPPPPPPLLHPRLRRGFLRRGFRPGIQLGFGFDPIKSDFKVVRVLFGTQIQPPEIGTLLPLAVYSLNELSWRSSSAAVASVDLDRIHHMWSPHFMNGAMHWLGSLESRNIECRNCIVLFDVVEESLTRMELPERECLGSDLLISEMKGLLAVSKNGVYDGGIVLHVWAMKEYGVSTSWTPICTINFEDQGLLSFLGFHGYGFYFSARKEAQVDNSQCDSKKLVMFDMKMNGCKDLVVDHNLYAYCMGTYVESLVLLNMGSVPIEPIRHEEQPNICTKILVVLLHCSRRPLQLLVFVIFLFLVVEGLKWKQLRIKL